VPTAGMVQKGFRVTGRVQGVFYRAWTRSVAEELGLSGWVRNRLDGSVEAQVGGSLEAVRSFEARLWEGPPDAVVDSVEGLESSGQLASGTFQILPTAG
jgi:acylphosphatase